MLSGFGKRDYIAAATGSAITILVFCVFSFLHDFTTQSPGTTAKLYASKQGLDQFKAPMEHYGFDSWRTPQTLEVHSVASTAHARFEVHKIRAEDGTIISDWLWLDEPAHVAALVHLKDYDKFLVFRQKKYGLDHETFATVGGYLEEGESLEACMRREIMEETGLHVEQLISLGDYRELGNRGGGTFHPFFARNSVAKDAKTKAELERAIASGLNKKQAPSASSSSYTHRSTHSNPFDYENQEWTIINRNELVQIVLDSHDVGVIGWMAAMAMSLLLEQRIQREAESIEGIISNATVSG